MPNIFDVIVLGLGGMGSAAAYQLAARGQRVLGLEQYVPAHHRGSSHGQSRIIRQAYYEGVEYVPLVLRAYELWSQLAHDTTIDLLQITGGLMIGPPDSSLIQGSLSSAQCHGLPHEMLDAGEIRRRFPPLTPGVNMIALHEYQAGIVRPEDGIRAHLTLAERHGARLQFEEPVTRWEADPSGTSVHITTTRGSYTAARLVMTPGAWAPDLLSDLGLPLVVERQVLYWFDPAGGITPFLPDRFPIYIWETEEHEQFYGFPALAGPQGGVKTAFFRVPNACTPATIDRQVYPDEIERMRQVLATRIPSLNAACIAATTCMYTLTPDMDFVIAPHPRHQQVIVACGFSGHGYKFASVVGEVLADLVIDGTTRHSINLFTPRRFVSQDATPEPPV